MTLLTALNDAQRLLSLPVTANIVADTQETQQLLYALAKREAAELMRRHDWPSLTRIQSFTATTGATLQTSGKPSDFDRAVPGGFWNQTTDRQVAGPLNEQEWALANGEPVTSTIQQYAMFRYDGLHIFPAPTAADTIAYPYIINTPVLDTDGTTYKTTWAADTDTFVLDEELLTLGVRWRYMQAKGRDYAEAMKDYELRIQNAINADRGTPRVLTVAPPEMDELSHPLIPETGFTGAP